MDESLTSEEHRLLETAIAFTREDVAPNAEGWERERRVPIEAYRKAADLELTGMLISPDNGGKGISNIAAARILEEVATGCLAFAMGLWVQNNVANGLVRNGSRDQIDRFVPALLKADRLGSFCLTEPHAGSDAAAIVTEAMQDGSEWELTGEKAWVVHGTVADILCVYCQTDPQKGWNGIMALIVEGDTAGFERDEPFPLMGAHALGTNGVRFDHCRVPDGNVLAGPGEGFKAAMAGINRARTFIAAMCCGMLRESLRVAVDYAAGRHAFGQAVLDFQGLQWHLSDVATDLEAARHLTYHAARALDHGEKAIVEAAHAKKFASRVALSGISECMEAMGANGFRTDNPLARHMANAKMTQYLDGTAGIQNVIIGRGLRDAYGTRNEK